MEEKPHLRKIFHIKAISPPSFVRRKQSTFQSSFILGTALMIFIVVCDIPAPVHSAPLPSSSAWSLPTLNYLFKDTKTRSQSVQYQKKDQSDSASVNQQNGMHHYKTLPEEGGSENNNEGDSPSQLSSPSTSASSSSSSTQLESKKNEGKMSSTGRLISVHDIRLTDNWGWVRRGVSDPSQTTEQRRKQNKQNNIRHSKSKHKQRRYPAPVSSSSLTSSKLSSKKKKNNTENLLCPFDEIRGPDGKCRKAPRFSLYRVGRK